MNVLNHLKGNFIMSGVGVGMAIALKHFLKKEILPVSSYWKIFSSYMYLTGVSIVGKLTIDKLTEIGWLHFSVKGKVPNEGFIGPLQGDLIYLISPNRWDNRGNPDRWVQPDQN